MRPGDQTFEEGLSGSSADFLTVQVSAALSGYEARPPQMEFLRACAAAVEKGGTLLAEAGTGTGKTFAYLIPLILSGRRGIVSTRTKNLQEQLFSKDLSFLATLNEFSYAILKGRANYLCLRRMKALEFVSKDELDNLRRLLIWAEETETGDLDEVPLIGGTLRPKVCCDADACLRTACPAYTRCFYFRARRKAEKALIVVVNHALLAVNAVLPDDGKVIPQAEVLVIDEAHTLDLILTDKAGVAVTSREIAALLAALAKEEDRGTRRRRVAAKEKAADGPTAVRALNDAFWEQVRGHFRDRQRARGIFRLRDEAFRLSSSIRSLVAARGLPDRLALFDDNRKAEVNGILIKLLAAAAGLEEFTAETDGPVRWVEVEESGVTLRSAPVRPRELFNTGVLPAYRSVILTSATLSVGGDFAFIDSLLGTAKAERLAVPSAFDLARQVRLLVRRGIDLAVDSGPAELARVIVEEARRREGGVLVLFTSRAVMKVTWDLCHQGLADEGFNAMIQGEVPNAEMLGRMRESTNSVIFGLDSFWEGIDVRGNALRTVIITKLPFDVPTEPITEARIEEIRSRGEEPFVGYSLPRAVLKFRQGVGRLIRSADDTGRIVICDERVETRQYGKVFLECVK